MRRWLGHAAATFGALEVNGSFYTQIARATYRRWRDEAPAGAVFTVKGHRFVTHYKRLRGVRGSIRRLRGQASGLGDKLVAALWQLPANLQADLPRLEEFLEALRGWPEVRHAIEFRHPSWFTEEVAERLRRAGVAVCMSDAPDFPLWREITTDLVYVRLHGHTRKYASSYGRARIARWVEDARRWARTGHDVHVYFDNDAEGAAVRNALAFHAELAARDARRRVASPRRGAGPAARRRRIVLVRRPHG